MKDSLDVLGFDASGLYKGQINPEKIHCCGVIKSRSPCIKKYPYSIGKGSKHTHIRYFFVVDKIEKKEVNILYCPTEKMVADYSTKTTQGSSFVKQRNNYQGIKAVDFVLCKSWHKKTLEKCNAWDNA